MAESPRSDGDESPAAPPTPVASAGTSSTERRALGYAAILAVIVAARVAAPLASGLLLGTLLAFAFQPVYRRVRELSSRGPGAAAASTVGFAATFVLGALGGLGYLLVARGVVLAQMLVRELGPSGRGRAALDNLTHALGPFQDRVGNLSGRLQDLLGAVATRGAGLAATLAGATFGFALTLFFVMLTMHFVLRNWSWLEQQAEYVLPINPRHTRVLFDEFRRVGRSVLLGTVITGVAQGVLAGIGYTVFGVTEPMFFATATAFASLVPVIGTLLIWIPIGLALIGLGHPGRGIGVLVWGALAVIGISDYVIRPRLVGKESEAPVIITFVALLGGVEAFGLIGLVLGPVAMALSMAVLRTYAAERRVERHVVESQRRSIV